MKQRIPPNLLRVASDSSTFHIRTCPIIRRTRHASTSSSSSVNEDEVAHFSRLSSQWWDEKGEFGLLHQMNSVRMQFIRDKLLEVRRDEVVDAEFSATPLNGLDVLDVGCGGGLLSESLTRLGARTVAVDASSSNIAIATHHASRDPALSRKLATGLLEYRNAAAESLLAESKRFDVVCSMEVIEHVDNPRDFLASCSELVKPGGHLFLSTISRTFLSYFLTIFAAEQVLRLVEPGTHTHSKYIKPSELVDFFSKPIQCKSSSEQKQISKPWISQLYKGEPRRQEAEVRGLIHIPWKAQWILAPRGAIGATECNYLFWARKPSSK